MISTPPPARVTPARVTLALVVALWVVVTAVVLGLGWLITHPAAGVVDGFDDPVSRWLAARRTPDLDRVAEVGTFLGETRNGAAVAVLASVGFAVWRRTPRPVVLVGLLEACVGGLYALATRLDPRDRPPVRILDRGLVPDHSFPSGHVATATIAFGLVVMLTWVYARSRVGWALPLLLVPVLVLLSRLYQGAHHVTDVLTSVAYASVFLLVLGRLILPSADPAGGPQA